MEEGFIASPMLTDLGKGEIVEEPMEPDNNDESEKDKEMEKNEEAVNKGEIVEEPMVPENSDEPKKDKEMEKNEEAVNGDVDLGHNKADLTSISNGSKEETVPEIIYCRVDADAENNTVELNLEEAELDGKTRNNANSDKEEDEGGCEEAYNNAAILKMTKGERARKKRRLDSSDKGEDDVQCDTDSNTNASLCDEDDKGLACSIKAEDDLPYGDIDSNINASSCDGDDKGIACSLKVEDDLQCGDTDSNKNASSCDGDDKGIACSLKAEDNLQCGDTDSNKNASSCDGDDKGIACSLKAGDDIQCGDTDSNTNASSCDGDDKGLACSLKAEDDLQCGDTDSNTNASSCDGDDKGLACSIKIEDDLQCGDTVENTTKEKIYRQKEMLDNSSNGDDEVLTCSIKSEDDLQYGDADANTNAATTKTKKRKRGRKKQMLRSSFDEDDKVLTNSISYDEDDGVKGNIRRPAYGGKKRGRKKKSTESYACNGDVSAGNTKGVVRVLRSNSKVTNAVNSLNESVSAGTSNQENDLFNNKTSKAHLIAMPKMKMKGRRGRPRKSPEESGYLVTTGSADNLKVSNISSGVSKSKEINPNNKLKRGRGRPRKLQQQSEHPNSTDFVEAIKPKKRPGRPSKVQVNSADFKASCSDNEVTVSNICGHIELSGDVSKSSVLPNGANTLACDLLSASERVVVEGIQENKHEDTGGKQIRRSIQKNILREQIVCILKDAGWKIEYKPRDGRPYNDAVYVSPEGKKYWSITLAYRMLKKKVESGDADSVTISAFSVIPEEEFTKLLRITTPGIKKGKRKKGKIQMEREVESEPSVTVASKSKLKGLSEEKKINSDHTRKRKLNSARKQSAKSHKQDEKRCTLLVRDSECHVGSDNEAYVLYEGKRSLLSWMIDLGTILLDGKVCCTQQRKSRGLLKGRITIEGILCDCCNEILSMSDFDSHAGNTTSQPLQTICLESGISLMQCLLNSWNKYRESEFFGFHYVDLNGEDPNDDTCNKCGDGGDLICCDGCPSAFHQSCLNIKNFPSGDWHCVYCTCKFCESVVESAHQKDEKCSMEGLELLNCCLCEQKYHKLCAPDYVALDVDSSCQSFCGNKCQEIFDQLQLCLGVQYQLEEGFSWRLVRLSGETQDELIASNPTKVQCYSELAVSYTILDECFKTILDQRSGINVIRNVVYSCGSNFKRLNYSGFLTAILERGDELISAASIRIHGSQLAEMPFIGTRHMYRRQGMCRRLLKAIESALFSLNVEKLVIPAIPELQQTWTCVFGFEPLKESTKKEMEHMNLIVFPGVDMLQKSMPVQQLHEINMESAPDISPNEFIALNKEDSTVVIPACELADTTLELADTSGRGNSLNSEQEKNEVEKSEAIVLPPHKHLDQSTSEEGIHVSQMDPLHSNQCLNGDTAVSESMEISEARNEIGTLVTDDNVPIPMQQHDNGILNGLQDTSIDCSSTLTLKDIHISSPLQAYNDSPLCELQTNTEEAHVGQFESASPADQANVTQVDPEISCVSGPQQPGLAHLCNSSTVEVSSCQLLNTTNLC